MRKSDTAIQALENAIGTVKNFDKFLATHPDLYDVCRKALHHPGTPVEIHEMHLGLLGIVERVISFRFLRTKEEDTNFITAK